MRKETLKELSSSITCIRGYETDIETLVWDKGIKTQTLKVKDLEGEICLRVIVSEGEPTVVKAGDGLPGMPQQDLELLAYLMDSRVGTNMMAMVDRYKKVPVQSYRDPGDTTSPYNEALESRLIWLPF